MSYRNHSLFTGVVPSTGIRVPSVAEAQAAVDSALPMEMTA